MRPDWNNEGGLRPDGTYPVPPGKKELLFYGNKGIDPVTLYFYYIVV